MYDKQNENVNNVVDDLNRRKIFIDPINKKKKTLRNQELMYDKKNENVNSVRAKSKQMARVFLNNKSIFRLNERRENKLFQLVILIIHTESEYGRWCEMMMKHPKSFYR